MRYNGEGVQDEIPGPFFVSPAAKTTGIGLSLASLIVDNYNPKWVWYAVVFSISSCTHYHLGVWHWTKIR